MKKFLSLLFMTAFLQLTPIQSAFSSNYLGGEITWLCQANGSYIFYLTLYRDCGGLTFPNTFQIQTTVPGVPTITLQRIAQNDLSPTGFQSNGTSLCPTCTGGGNPIPGMVEENIYESASTQLNGIPPANGWTFYFNMCCRNGTVINLFNAGSQSLRIQSKMYPYNNLPGFPCYDASPFFAEKPANVMCSGQPASLQYLSIDTDDDFLTYKFTDALNDQGVPIQTTLGYSASNPLPGPAQNPSNTLMDLDTLNGETLFTVNGMGNYNINMTVTSWRMGTKVSEVIRSHDFYMLSNCPGISGSQPNLYPQSTAPFVDPVTGLFTSYDDTVLAGNTVTFQKIVTDNDQFSNGTPQQITLTGAGNQFGANFTNPSSGCLMPPCAVMNATLPKVFTASDTSTFTWTTNNAHLGLTGPLQAKTWYFLLRAMDNYCPAMGMNARIASVTVVNSLSGLNETEFISDFSAYPNPATSESFELTWQSNSQKPISVAVTDVTGRELFRKTIPQTIGKNSTSIELSSAANGIYFLKASIANGKTRQKKIILAKP